MWGCYSQTYYYNILEVHVEFLCLWWPFPPLPHARSVVGWIDVSDRPSSREAARAYPHYCLSPGLLDRENSAHFSGKLASQWPDVFLPEGRLWCGGFCFVLFDLQLSVHLWWHDYRREDFPTLKLVVVMANPLAIC